MGPPILKRNGRCGAPSCSTFSIPPDSGRAVSPGASVAGPPRPLWEPPGPLRARARADLGRKPPQAGHGSPAPAFLRRPRGNSRRSDRSPRRARSCATPQEEVSAPTRSPVSPQAGNQNIRASRASIRRTVLLNRVRQLWVESRMRFLSGKSDIEVRASPPPCRCRKIGRSTGA